MFVFRKTMDEAVAALKEKLLLSDTDNGVFQDAIAELAKQLQASQAENSKLKAENEALSKHVDALKAECNKARSDVVEDLIFGVLKTLMWYDEFQSAYDEARDEQYIEVELDEE